MADFKLGRIKFKWRGDWAVDTSYLIDDVIKYGGNTYVCIQNHTSPSAETSFYTSPGTYTAYWSLQAESLYFKGTYAADTWYKLNDLVKYGARQYRCTTGHTSASVVGGVAILNGSNFELYIDTTDYKGEWTVDTYYKVNDVFKFGAYLYKVDTAHTSASSTDGFDQSVVSVYLQGQEFEDSYNASTVYSKGDIVTYGGYSYIYVNDEEASGQTPTDNSYWDVFSTGYSNVGGFTYGNPYKTGEVVNYGGNVYVAKTNNQNQRPVIVTDVPTDTYGTNSTHWDLLVEGFNYQGTYSAVTAYNIGDVVRYVSSSYIMLKDQQTNVTPGTDGTVWGILAQGDTGAVLTTRGDLLYQDATQSTRLPIGIVGSVLTTDGAEPTWSNAEGKNVIYVANSGSDSNPGSQFLPFKSIYKALSVATSGDIVDFDTVTGGTGGTPATYDLEQTNSDGSGTSATIRAVIDGSSTPTVTITDGGTGHAAGDVITFGNIASDGSTVQGGGMTDITITVVSASVGDVVYVKNGVYRETLPLRIPSGVTVQGESLRGTEVRPNTGTGHQIKTFTQSGGTAGTAGTYNYVHGTTTTSTNGIASSVVVNVVQDGSSAPTVTLYHGGTGFVVSDTVTVPSGQIGNPSGGDLILTVATLENNDASNMFLLNNTTNLVQMTMKGLTGTPGAGGTSKAAVTSLDPSGSITTASPYIQNCTSINSNATGIQIDGLIHNSGNKSILANDFTQINSDGIGVHAIGGGRGEMVSVFTYYASKSFFAESGGFIRGLNCSSAYGEIGAEANGTLSSEGPITVSSRGEVVKYDATTFVGAATESDVADTVTTSGTPTAATITGDTSGATATILRVNISLDYLHIENRSGNFQQGETVTIIKDDSSTYQVDLDGSTGDSSAAQIGQIGPLIAVDSSDGTLGSTSVIKVGTNIQFSGDSKYYRVSAVSETNISNETALVRLTESIITSNAIADNTSTTVTENFSNVRLTGHDFLDIGTGGFADTNYPGAASQPADQNDEVEELNGGRVYFTSTDQKGDFRVGDLFRIEQATGVATLNADAFDLSGLSELQLGSIGAELGATINEFSTDETMSGDSNSAIPTERAIVGYTQRDQMGTGHLVPPTGTTAQRPTGGNLKTGGVRYNSTLVTWEGYNGTQWTGLGGGNPWASTSSSITVAANDRYFVDTTSSALTITLPASPQTGDQVSLLDLAGTFDTNNLTVGRNGNNIMGAAEDLTIAVENAGIQLVYTGATNGWKLTNNF
jgi:hypothetical protein